LFLFLTIASIIISFAGPVWATEDVSRAYLYELVTRANGLRLAETREWQVLLHYRRNLWGGYTSEQDAPGFFLASDGKVNPQSELAATLSQFFSDEFVGRSKQPAQCAFVARYSFLKERLAFDPERLRPLVCERFNNWLADFDVEGISLIFPTGFMNNPSSMFGHTFLRIDQKGQTPYTRILASTINFAAELPPDAGIEYPIKGIFGMYPGYFSTIPYYLKVQEYRDIENRDIWEYRLNLTPDQVRRLLMHAWEMGNATFDYYFFGENCSYHILALLDAADPAFRLADQFPYYTIPADSMRAVLAQQGLVGAVVYRPSRLTLVKRKRELLDQEEDRWLRRLLEKPDEARSESFSAVPQARRVLLLDTASDYLLLRSEGAGEKENPWRDRNKIILSARAELKTPSPDMEVQPFVDRPDAGHETRRIGVGAGWRNNRPFEEVAFRGAYHDILDPERGYTPDAQIEIVSLAIRKYAPANWYNMSMGRSLNESQVRLERFSLFNMVSLAPMDSLFHAPSWKLGIGMNTIHHNTCQLCSNGVFNAGMGGSTESHWLRRELWFAFAETEANYSKAYEERHRIGGGGTIGLLADITDRWKLLISGTYLRYALGEHGDDVRWTVGQRVTILQNFSLRLDYNHRDRDDDVVFSGLFYF